MRSSNYHIANSHTTEPFEDEIHPRLRFPHRGIVASANNGTRDSQLVGSSVFSLLEISSVNTPLVAAAVALRHHCYPPLY